MSKYAINEISLPAFPGAHRGTGTWSANRLQVVPASVPGTAALQFVTRPAQVTTRLFAIADKVVPNWFGVAIPSGITDFTKAHVFFHPMPGQAGYKESDYASKAGLWPKLFYYMERLGYQLDGAKRGQIVVMPFLTNSATNTGIFAANWSDIVTDILTQVRADAGADDGSALALSGLVVSSFSVGIVYSASFRATAPALGPLTEVWDFDGLFSTASTLSRNLVDTVHYSVIKYDQNPASGVHNYHVPLPRWTALPTPPKNANQVHGRVCDHMFLHAATLSTVGQKISAGASSGASRTPSGPASASASRSVSSGSTSVVTSGSAGSSRPSGSGSRSASRSASGSGSASMSHSASGSGAASGASAAPGSGAMSGLSAISASGSGALSGSSATSGSGSGSGWESGTTSGSGAASGSPPAASGSGASGGEGSGGPSGGGSSGGEPASGPSGAGTPAPPVVSPVGPTPAPRAYPGVPVVPLVPVVPVPVAPVVVAPTLLPVPVIPVAPPPATPWPPPAPPVSVTVHGAAPGTCSGGCTAIVGAVGVVSVQAITAITAIAGLARTRR